MAGAACNPWGLTLTLQATSADPGGKVERHEQEAEGRTDRSLTHVTKPTRTVHSQRHSHGASSKLTTRYYTSSEEQDWNFIQSQDYVGGSSGGVWCNGGLCDQTNAAESDQEFPSGEAKEEEEEEEEMEVEVVVVGQRESLPYGERPGGTEHRDMRWLDSNKRLPQDGGGKAGRMSEGWADSGQRLPLVPGEGADGPSRKEGEQKQQAGHTLQQLPVASRLVDSKDSKRLEKGDSAAKRHRENKQVQNNNYRSRESVGE